VLSEYFEVVESTQTIDEAEGKFMAFLSDIQYTPEDRVPFPRREFGSPPVSPSDMKQLAVRRTSTRWFQERQVPRELIDDCLEVAMQSPSACNRQSYEFRIYDEPELIDAITSLAIGTTGYRDNIPCLAVIVGQQRAYFDARDKHVIYIDASLAAMSFQFALETHGLASCCINWPTIPRNERKMANLLNLSCDEEVIMLMAIGYPDPDGMIPYSEKKAVENVRSYNKR
jgi:nitroreductase